MRRILSSVVCLIFAAGIICSAESAALQEARRLLASGRPDQAITLLRSQVEANPSDFEARVLLGTTLALRGARSDSITQMAEAVKLRPDSAEAYNLMGVTLSRFQELEDAKQAFERAIQLDPRLADAHVNLSMILAQKGDWENAGAHLDCALARERDASKLGYDRYLRAQVFVEQTKFQQADEQLEQSVRIRPGFADAWSELGWLRGFMSDEDGAIRALRRAVQLNANDPTIQYRMGAAYLRQGKLDLAVLHLRAAYQLDANDRSILYDFERALRKAGQVEEAANIATRLKEQLQSSHNSSQNLSRTAALNNEGMKLEEEGNIRDASEKYRIALQLDPTAAGIRLNYGMALCRMRQWKEGIAEIQEVLRLDPDNGDAMRALYIAQESEKHGTTGDSLR